MKNLMLALAAGLVWSGVAALPELRVSENRHFLMTADGQPFFWLADTAWEMFHRLNREEVVTYLDNRAKLGFTAVQAVAIAEEDGLGTPNAYGHCPFVDAKTPTPRVVDGPDNDYWDHVDFVVDAANKRGIYVGFLPTWGSWWQHVHCIFTPETARTYGEWLGRRYRDKGIVWILGGDRKPEQPQEFAILDAFAAGLKAGDGGKHLFTFHPWGGGASSEHFHQKDWLSFNFRQNGHEIDYPRYAGTLDDWNRTNPVKPVIDGEPVYEGHPVAFNPDRFGHTLAADIRRALYWDLFNGACGHTYGHHSIWQCFGAKRTQETDPNGKNRPLVPFMEAINDPGASQLQYAKQLILSHDFFTRIPAPDLIVPDRIRSRVPGAGTRRFVATRDTAGTYAFVYAPVGFPFTVNLKPFTGGQLKASWMNPRTGAYSAAETFAKTDTRTFTPPTPGEELDWVLVIETVK